jgi:hypothetical protein
VCLQETKMEVITKEVVCSLYRVELVVFGVERGIKRYSVKQ